MVRNLFLSVLLVAIANVSHGQYVNLHLADTTTQSYALADIRSISYNQDQMQMTLIDGNHLYWNTSFINYIDYDDLNLSVLDPSQELTKQFSIYPNPSNSSVNVKVDSHFDGYVSLAIFNLQGQIVKTLFEGELKSGSTRMRWDANNANGLRVSPGTYVFAISSEKQRVSRILILTD